VTWLAYKEEQALGRVRFLYPFMAAGSFEDLQLVLEAQPHLIPLAVSHCCDALASLDRPKVAHNDAKLSNFYPRLDAWRRLSAAIGPHFLPSPRAASPRR
jgi:hypothetical protein